MRNYDAIIGKSLRSCKQRAGRLIIADIRGKFSRVLHIRRICDNEIEPPKFVCPAALRPVTLDNCRSVRQPQFCRVRSSKPDCVKAGIETCADEVFTLGQKGEEQLSARRCGRK